MKKSFLTVLAVIGLLISCDKDYNTVGSDLIGDGNYSFLKEEIEDIIVYSKATEAVQSNNLPVNSLGVYSDEFFGTQISSFVSQVELETPNPTIGVDVEIQSTDSVYLYVPYFSSRNSVSVNYLPQTYTLDSIVPKLQTWNEYSNLSIDLKIYQNGYFLSSVNSSDPTMNMQYFSGKEPYDDRDLIENHYASGMLNDPMDVSQSSEFKLSREEYVIYKTNGNGEYLNLAGNVTNVESERVVKGRLAPGIWINLDKDHFKNNVLLAGESNLITNSNFKEYFKGIYLKASKNATDGFMAQLDFSKGYIAIQYHSRADASSDLKKKSIKLKFSGNTINFFENIPDSQYTNALVGSSENTGSDIVPIKGNNGAAAFVKIFENDQAKLEDYRARNLLINDAILTLYVKSKKNGVLDQNIKYQNNPKRLYLYDATNNRLILDYSLDPSTASDSKYNKYNFGGILETEPSTGYKKYRIRLTSYIKYLLDENNELPEGGIKFGVVVTENINTASFASLKEADDFYVDDLIPVGSVMNPLGTVVYGNNPPAGMEDRRAKIEIYYTEPK